MTTSQADAQSAASMHRARANAQAAQSAQKAAAPAPAKAAAPAPSKAAAPAPAKAAAPAPAKAAAPAPAKSTITTPARISAGKSTAPGARTRQDSASVSTPAPAPAPRSVAVVMTPATPPTEVAAVLATKAPGDRVVHLAGFAGDVAAYDSVKPTSPDAGSAKPALAQPSVMTDTAPAVKAPEAAPVLPIGTATVSARVKESMAGLRDVGAKVDAFTVEVPTVLAAGPAADAVLAKAVDAAVREIYPDAKSPERSVGDAEGGIASDGQSSSSGAAQAPVQQDPVAAGIADLTKKTVANAHMALAALDRQRLPQSAITLQYRGIDWNRVFELARDNPAIRGTLFAFVSAADQVVAADASRYRRPATLTAIPTDMLDPIAATAGPNREVRALAMADCTQADFVRSKGLTLAIAARYGNDPQHLAKILEILGEVAKWEQFQRPGWSLGDPARRMPDGGDGVNMATAWGVNGVVDIMHVLG
ncbi:MAG: hypothetical protein FGM37_10485, partial [Phycisphaerales bacterium]|nr:hypothetical protein [Phycisphaerales bacterium]